MNILAIDTSNQTMGIAIQIEGQLVAEYTTNVKKNHSVRLMPAINQLMQDTGLNPGDLDRIVVAKGPGSYTGVRIGLSTAKTMAWSLGIAVVAVSSLEVIALQGKALGHQVCPFFDARRGLVYTGLYSLDSIETMQAVWKEENILFDHWLERLAQEQKKTVFLSQDMKLHEERIRNYMGDLAIIPDSIYHYPRPGLLAWVGSIREPEELHTLTPNYLRLAEAEAKWLEQEKNKNA